MRLPPHRFLPNQRASPVARLAVVKVLSENLAAAFAFLTPPESTQSVRERSDSRETTVSSPSATRDETVKDTLQISAAAESQLTADDELTDRRDDQSSAATDATQDEDAATKTSAIRELTDEEQEVVDELKATDREVRAHEQAHLAAAGPYAKGGPTYTYEEGPDGQQYAVGGEVAIDTAPVSGDPEATVQKARIIRAAALAPAEPSAQDRAVAAAATKMEAQALQELREQQSTGDDGNEDEPYIANQQEAIGEIVAAGLLLDVIG